MGGPQPHHLEVAFVKDFLKRHGHKGKAPEGQGTEIEAFYRKHIPKVGNHPLKGDQKACVVRVTKQLERERKRRQEADAKTAAAQANGEKDPPGSERREAPPASDVAARNRTSRDDKSPCPVHSAASPSPSSPENSATFGGDAAPS